MTISICVKVFIYFFNLMNEWMNEWKKREIEFVAVFN